MTDEEYQETQTQLNLLTAVLKNLDLREFLNRISTAEAAGPVLDPTLFRHAADNLLAVKNIASAALKLQSVCSKEYDLELERRGRRVTE